MRLRGIRVGDCDASGMHTSADAVEVSLAVNGPTADELQIYGFRDTQARERSPHWGMLRCCCTEPLSANSGLGPGSQHIAEQCLPKAEFSRIAHQVKA